MTTALTYDQVMDKLPAIVAECLALDLEEVTPEMVFSRESIEFLDLNFRCEKAFGIKSPFRLLLGARDQLVMDPDGYFADESLQLLRRTYPFLAVRFDADGVTRLQVADLFNYITVDAIANFVVQASEQQAGNVLAAQS